MEQQTQQDFPSKGIPASSFVSPRLTKGMTEEEIKKFEGAYLRAKRPLKAINSYARKEAQAKLDLIDNPNAYLADDWHNKVLWNAGYRYAMRVVLELTRT